MRKAYKKTVSIVGTFEITFNIVSGTGKNCNKSVYVQCVTQG